MTGGPDPITLATRGSDLARRQAAKVADGLRAGRRTVELVEVETEGDRISDELIHRLGTTGAFVRSLDEKVMDGTVDAAVHSMKDMPTDSPEDLIVAGVPERGPAADVIVTPSGDGLDELSDNAIVGTSSLRRRAQLLAARPELAIDGLRGNVDTRVEKVLAPSLQREHQRLLEAEEADGDGDADPQAWFDDLTEIERRALGRETETEYDAIVLAEAGLDRLGLLSSIPTARLDRSQFVPAAGQGAIAVTALDSDLAETIYDAIDHPPSRVETTVERTILDELGGGCVAPIGIAARLQGAVVTTTVRVLARDGTETIGATRELPVERHAPAAREFASDLADQGAADLVEQARREEPDEAKRGS